MLAGKSARVGGGGRAEAAVAGRRPGTSHLCRPAALGTGTAAGSIHCTVRSGARSWQVLYPRPAILNGILVKHLSTLQRTNSTNREKIGQER